MPLRTLILSSFGLSFKVKRLKFRTVFIQLIIGILLLSIPFITSPDLESGLQLLKIKPFQYHFTGYFLLLVFFYSNYYILIPRFYISKKYGIYLVLLIGCYAVISLLPNLLFDLSAGPDFNSAIKPPENTPPPSFPPFQEGPQQRPANAFISQQALFKFRESYILQFALVTGLSLLMRLNTHLKQIQKEKLIAEVSYLKAQINPHFLFNTLNSLYALALRKSDEAPEAILKLSGMMRYVVTESNHTRVALKKELDYLNDYVALQKLRLAANVKLSFKVKGEPKNLEIAPLILITYIENAFKYGINPDENSEININIDVREKGVELRVTNRIVITKNTLSADSGEGQRNTQKRLDHLYPSKYELFLKEADGFYEVKLYLELV